MNIWKASSSEEIAIVRILFREYQESLGLSQYFKGFEKELANLPGQYSSPDGLILLAEDQKKWVGCVALRRFDSSTAEIKRLYIRPVARGKGLGRVLLEEILRYSRQSGYKRVVLDTLPTMESAIHLYRTLDFREIQHPYPLQNQVAGLLYFERKTDH